MVFLLSALLSACGVAYQKRADDFVRTQPESAWGVRPPEGHERAEIEWVRTQLKDPYSADVRAAGLNRYVLPATFTDPTVIPVWGSKLDVNAKNSFGAFTGSRPWMFYYRDAVLFAVEDSEGIRTWVGQSSSYTNLQRALSDLSTTP